jgi:hypothetical protein
MFPTSELLSRSDLLKHFDISDSSERRHRQADPTWPPHVCIGKKVFYRRSSINDWLDQREASCRQETPDASGCTDRRTEGRIVLRDNAIANIDDALPTNQTRPSLPVWSGWGGGLQ